MGADETRDGSGGMGMGDDMGLDGDMSGDGDIGRVSWAEDRGWGDGPWRGQEDRDMCWGMVGALPS